MKRLLLLVPALIVLLVAGLVRGSSDPAPAKSPEPKVDIDLSILNRNMVYARIYDMMTKPAAYRGKTVRMKGTYAPVFIPDTGKRYHACLVSDAMACCSQGIEFAPTNAVAYPDDFPNEGQPIVVQGVFATYKEDDRECVHIRDAVLSFAKRPPRKAP